MSDLETLNRESPCSCGKPTILRTRIDLRSCGATVCRVEHAFPKAKYRALLDSEKRLREENKRLKADQRDWRYIALELRGRFEALEAWAREAVKAADTWRRLFEFSGEDVSLQVRGLPAQITAGDAIERTKAVLVRARELGVSESEPSRLMQCPTCGHQETTTHVGTIQCGPHGSTPACDMRELEGSDAWE